MSSTPRSGQTGDEDMSQSSRNSSRNSSRRNSRKRSRSALPPSASTTHVKLADEHAIRCDGHPRISLRRVLWARANKVPRFSPQSQWWRGGPPLPRTSSAEGAMSPDLCVTHHAREREGDDPDLELERLQELVVLRSVARVFPSSSDGQATDLTSPPSAQNMRLQHAMPSSDGYAIYLDSISIHPGHSPRPSCQRPFPPGLPTPVFPSDANTHFPQRCQCPFAPSSEPGAPHAGRTPRARPGCPPW